MLFSFIFNELDLNYLRKTYNLIEYLYPQSKL